MRNGPVIQAGAFTKENNAIRAKEELLKISDRPTFIIFENGLYKVQMDGFQNNKQALYFLPIIQKSGFQKAFVIRTDHEAN